MYLIPRNVKARFEFFPGFGWFELISVVGGAVVGLFLYALASFFTHNPFWRASVFIAPPGLAYITTKPGLDGESFYTRMRFRQKWMRSQKRYLYATKGE